MPDTQKILENMGEQIKMARLRRNLSAELVAELQGIKNDHEIDMELCRG